MFLHNQASCSSSQSNNSNNNSTSNFSCNNSQIIALFAPKPIQSTGSRKQLLFHNNGSYSKQDHPDHLYGMPTLRAQNKAAPFEQNYSPSTSFQNNICSVKCSGKNDVIEAGFRENSIENRKFQKASFEAEIKKTETQSDENVHIQEESNCNIRDFEVYRPRNQTYNHQHDLQVAGREIFQILNKSKYQQQAKQSNKQIFFIESTQNPHASQIDKLHQLQQPLSLSDFSTCSDINMTACEYPYYHRMQYNYCNLQSERTGQQYHQSIHNLRSMSHHQQEDNANQLENQNEQFFFGDGQEDSDQDQDQQNSPSDTQNVKAIRTLDDVMLEYEQQQAFQSQKESNFNMPFHTKIDINNQSQIMRAVSTTYQQCQSQNFTRKPHSFHQRQQIN